MDALVHAGPGGGGGGGGALGARDDLVAHVLRGRAQRPHARAARPHQRRLHVPAALARLPGELSRIVTILSTIRLGASKRPIVRSFASMAVGRC